MQPSYVIRTVCPSLPSCSSPCYPIDRNWVGQFLITRLSLPNTYTKLEDVFYQDRRVVVLPPFTRGQGKYYLMEQLKGIKKELGMVSDGEPRLIENFTESAKALKITKVFDGEASEANSARNCLE